MGLNKISPSHHKIPTTEIPEERKMSSPPMHRLRRLGVLIWKNAILVRKRHWIITLLEIVVPLALFAIMAVIRANSSDFGSTSVDNHRFYPPFDQRQFQGRLNEKHIHYAPINNFTKTLMARVNTFRSVAEEAKGYASEIEMLFFYNSLMNDSSKSIYFGCVVFEGEAATANLNKVPKKLEYKIRFPSQFKTDSFFDENFSGHEQFNAPYFDSGFLGLQFLVNKAFIEMAQGQEKKQDPVDLKDKFFLQRMPYPPYVNDLGYTEIMKVLLPFVSMMSFLILCVTVTKRVVQEKQTGAKELMKLMGMEDWAFWLSWLIDAMIVRAISIGLIIWLLTYPFNSASGAVLEETSVTLLFFMLVVYCIAAITFLFAISTFFQRPVVAMVVSIIVWFLSLSVPYYFVDKRNPGFWLKVLSMIFPNMGLHFTFSAILDFEKRGLGAQWSNLHESGTGLSRDLSLLNVLIMLVLDTIIYSLITWYVSEVHPGEYGFKRPYDFFLSKTYWLGEHEKQTSMEATSDDNNTSKFETPLSLSEKDESVGIMIRNLHKTYPGQLGRPPVYAVRGVSLDITKGGITALLGHNGAGKTTTMSILTGMISSSGGTVRILGKDLKEDLLGVRQLLGLCPQHDLLFDELTVYQHLVFFAMLKGSSHDNGAREAHALLETVGLKEKGNAFVAELSGGMKRKLSLAIALIGGSQVVMLDEPTSGLDVEARREIWRLLKNIRCEKTILLSTHFMEEADALGDTIAIMAHGKVMCCGSSLFLKAKYGAGYHLSLLRADNECPVEEVKSIIEGIVPNASMECSRDQVNSSNGSNQVRAGPINFTLPSTNTENYPKLFETLQNRKNELHISTIGVSVTTMEEVFLKVGQMADEEHGDQVDSVQARVNGQERVNVKALGWSLFLEQCQALLEKKFLVSKRQWLYVVMQIILPALTILGAILASNGARNIDVDTEPALPISLAQYGSSSRLHVVYAAEPGISSELAKGYASLVRGLAEPEQVSENIYKSLLNAGRENLAFYRSDYIAAAQFNTSGNDLSLIGLYGIEALHSAPISLDLISNALLKYYTYQPYAIITQNHPLPVDSQMDHLNSLFALAGATTFIWLALAHLGWIFTAAMTVVLPLQERVNSSRQLQIMAGCPLWLIWVTYLLVDIVLILFVSLVVIAIIFPFDTNHTFTSSSEIGVLLLVFFMYGLAGTTFSYLASFAKDTVPSVFGFIIFLGVFAGGTVNLIVYALELFPVWAGWGSALRFISGLLIPHSAFISSLAHFSGVAVYNSMCSNIPPLIKEFTCSQTSNGLVYSASMCCENLCEKLGNCFKPLPYLSLKGSDSSGDFDEWITKHGPIGQEIIYFAVGTVMWFTFVLLLDSGLFGRSFEQVCQVWESLKNHRSGTGGDTTDAPLTLVTVGLQKNQKNKNIEPEGNVSNVVLEVTNLKKQYGIPLRGSRFSAVKDISFKVHKGECYGLLGVNGAGKSTTFKMLTGATAPTGGDATLGQPSLQRDRSRFLSGIGYCPQSDAQLSSLTGREMLTLYAKLRGEQNPAEAVTWWLNALGLVEYADRPSASYSGGNRRKLSAAMALIGSPPVALLDEPTSGVDPISRRQLWQALTACQRNGQSIVLTSHSMDECEALCSNLAIMVAGKVVCEGPIGELKDKYGQGHTLMAKVKSLPWGSPTDQLDKLKDDLESLKAAIKEAFKPCELLDEHQGLLHFHIQPGQQWSDLFEKIQKIKADHSIMEDYTLSETTLEQVFLYFAKKNVDG